MSALAPDRLAAMTERDVRCLRELLAKLPPEGWAGTPTELADRFRPICKRHWNYAPRPAGLAGFLARFDEVVTAAGWRVEHSRTRNSRQIAFRPV